jgi:hypothetical protein
MSIRERGLHRFLVQSLSVRTALGIKLRYLKYKKETLIPPFLFCDITQMLKILCKCGQLDGRKLCGRTRAVFPSCMPIFPEVQ